MPEFKLDYLPGRRKTMDRKLLSSEKHEVAYMAKKLKCSQKLVQLAREKAGRSRVKVTAFVVGYRAARDEEAA